MSHWWAPGSRGPMWGLASANMSPSTQKDRANVWESQPRHPLHLPPSFKALSLSRLTLPLLFLLLLLLHIRASLSVAASLSRAHIGGAGGLFSPPSPPFLASSLVPLPPPPPLLPGAAVIFPHLRLIPGSGGMYDFICMVPAFYWIPIALEQRYRIPNSSRANLIQNSWSGHPSRCQLQCALCVLRVPQQLQSHFPLWLETTGWIPFCSTPKTSLFYSPKAHNRNIRQPNAAASFQPEKQRGDGDG